VLRSSLICMWDDLKRNLQLSKIHVTLRCGKNPGFDIDKDSWVWPNTINGESCSKVFFMSPKFTLSSELFR
jgi:hypothetical protein